MYSHVKLANFRTYFSVTLFDLVQNCQVELEIRTDKSIKSVRQAVNEMSIGGGQGMLITRKIKKAGKIENLFFPKFTSSNVLSMRRFLRDHGYTCYFPRFQDLAFFQTHVVDPRAYSASSLSFLRLVNSLFLAIPHTFPLILKIENSHNGITKNRISIGFKLIIGNKGATKHVAFDNTSHNQGSLFEGCFLLIKIFRPSLKIYQFEEKKFCDQSRKKKEEEEENNAYRTINGNVFIKLICSSLVHSFVETQSLIYKIVHLEKKLVFNETPELALILVLDPSHKSLFGLGLDIPGESEERGFNILVELGTGLYELHAVLDGELFAPLLAHLSPVVHVALVSDEHSLYIGGRVLLDVADPVSDRVERFFGRDVVDEQDAHGAPVVRGGYGAKALLAGRVPNLQLDLLAVQLDGADLEVYAYGADERGVVLVFGEAEEHAGLADARVADQQQFEQVVVRFGHLN
ncbi:hypothetical protein BpHYR1_038514 [Brachionus plicatilis]|uniref:Uncharacterized protein n=1 Tax=Brachionus plicatilis TaxID=10195 RepID=A0A3M7PDP5_BRAPC|nr:hypothetical protein BpHYR1_038514 [Brachionus plicatilis]